MSIDGDSVQIELSIEASTSLLDYLAYHEEDIAWGTDDFGYLKEVFHEMSKRKARKNTDD